MDHHCPWTVNCVSHRTFPHFFRFLFYAVISMSYLECFLYIRVGLVWSGRNLPSVRVPLRPPSCQWLIEYYTVPWSFSSRFDISLHHISGEFNRTLCSCHVVNAQHLDPGFKRLDDRRLGDRKTRDPSSASQSIGRLS